MTAPLQESTGRGEVGELVARLRSAALAYAERPVLVGVIDEAADALEAMEREHAESRDMIEMLTRGKSPCGHWSAYAHEVSAGKIICWQCRAEAAETALASERRERDAIAVDERERAALAVDEASDAYRALYNRERARADAAEAERDNLALQVRTLRETGQNRALADDIERWRREASAAEARADRLEAALRPFAEHGRALEGACPSDQWCEAEYPDGIGTHWLAVEHFHEAARALTPEGERSEGGVRG